MAETEKAGFGTLVVVVDKARNLPNRKTLGKQDVYTIVRLGHEVQRTPTDKRAGQVPAWNHEMRFKVPAESENILKLSIFNESSRTPDLIGDCSVDLSALFKKHEFDSWLDLRYKDKPAGEVYVELTFYYTGPPKPRPKIALAKVPSRSNTASDMAVPVNPRHDSHTRRESAPMRTRPLSEVNPDYDPSRSLSNLNLGDSPGRQANGPRDFAKSPYQPGVQYADTWDGVRDDRVLPPGPGDVRRKSFSAMTRPDERLLVDNNGRSTSSLGYYQKNAEPALSNNHQTQVASRRKSYDPRIMASNADYRAARRSPDRRSPMRDYVTDSDPVYVEPILDPRHGSPYEPRNTMRIVSPLPEYAEGFNGHHGQQQNSYDRRSPGCVDRYDYNQTGSPGYTEAQRFDPRHSPRHQDYDQRHSPLYSSRGHTPDQRHSPSRSPHGDHPSHSSGVRTGHVQANSYSQPSRYIQDYEQGPASHIKSASTSATHNQTRYPSVSQQRSYSPLPYTNGRGPAAGYSDNIQYQAPDSYAPTPAQYVSTNRPLPVAPNAPPSKPAKIPLGLTQEEYDILYGRA